MAEFDLDPEEADNFEDNLHRLNDAVRQLLTQQTALSEQLLAITGRLFRIEQGQK